MADKLGVCVCVLMRACVCDPHQTGFVGKYSELTITIHAQCLHLSEHFFRLIIVIAYLLLKFCLLILHHEFS